MDFPRFEGYQLTEREIRYAMANSTNNTTAAEFLRISLPTYRKYAKMYIDAETGKTLYDLHSTPANKKSRKNRKWFRSAPEIMDNILNGVIKPPVPWKFKYFLIRERYLEEKCADCGFCERRITDGSIPLILVYIDGDRKNGKRENLKLMCYNCYFLQIQNIWGKPRRPSFEIETDIPWKALNQ